MIDYEKLKLAHELARKLSTEKDKIFLVSIMFITNHYTEYRLHDDAKYLWFRFQSLDELIAKLQELTQPEKPKSKYKVGDQVYVLECGCKDSYKTTIKDITESWKYWLEGGLGYYEENDIYPSREALIESQIEYWNKMHCEDGRHEYCDDATGYKSICIHCDKSEFSCLKNEEKSTCNDYMSMESSAQESCHHFTGSISENVLARDLICLKCGKYFLSDFIVKDGLQESCQHERDEMQPPKYSMSSTDPYKLIWKYKCKKCGEFYS